MKICSTCKILKELNEFHANKNHKDGRNSRCKVCELHYQVEYRTNNKERLKIWRKRKYPREKARRIESGWSHSPKGRLSIYKCHAKKRKFSFDLTFEQFMIFWQKSCSYCGDSIETIGIDRVNTKIGYRLDNCVSCCITCNRMKMDHSFKDWINHMQKISQHLKCTGHNIKLTTEELEAINNM